MTSDIVKVHGANDMKLKFLHVVGGKMPIYRSKERCYRHLIDPTGPCSFQFKSIPLYRNLHLILYAHSCHSAGFCFKLSLNKAIIVVRGSQSGLRRSWENRRRHQQCLPSRYSNLVFITVLLIWMEFEWKSESL